ncbi:MAG: DNA polymerase I, partial [Candidatus Krumholzibacteria bacterium]|nr:DNA polymerase I [Candidatus Krumholzibacteria bacterium]
MSLYLVDGHALAYRSYYAFIRRPLVNSRGEETSAVFGFVRTMLNLVEKFDPTHVAVAFDSTGTTFRTELFADYKANRPKMPEPLVSQLPKIFSVLEAMSIPMLSVDGYEADDVIATVTKRLASALPICVVSGDKDLYQIVSENTHVIRPGKNGLLEDEIDPQVLRERFGLRPEQFVDYQALMGDPSDNVPGVRGVGQKTALKLIQQFGSLEEIYLHLESVASAALRKKLQQGKEQALLSRELVHLKDSVPIDVSMETMTRRPFDLKALRRLFGELEFDQMLETLGPSEEQRVDEGATDYKLVDSEALLKELAITLRHAAEFAIDVESSDLDAMKAVLAGITFSTGDGRAWYVPVTSVIEEEQSLLTPPREAPGLPLATVVEQLGPAIADAKLKKVGQNIKYDIIVLSNAGIDLGGVSFDTMLASYCLHPARRSHGLDSLVDEFFGHRMISFRSLFESRTARKDIRTVPLNRVCEYACEDADYTLRLKNVLARMLEASQVKTLFERVEMPLAEVLTRMEMRGVALDVPFLKKLRRDLEQRLTKIQRSIYEEVGEEFNINSTARLQDILFVKLGLKPTHKTKTGYSTDTDVLKSLSSQHAVPDLVIEYRMLSKLKNTYVDALPRLVNPRTGRLHTSYNQAVASTGRLSSSDPNLQNIPIRTPLGREIRRAFVADGEDRVLLDADYSQIELRIMAHLSQDAGLLKAFAEDADVHRSTAAKIMGVTLHEVSDDMRARAKTVNFGIMYGMGARGLAQSLDISVKEAKEFIDDYFRKYPGVRRFIDDTIAVARRDKAVSTLLGRVRQLPDIDSGDRRTQAFSERMAVNTPIQGTAADIIKGAMVELDAQLHKRGLRSAMILQVHDELLIDALTSELEEVTAVVRDAMENAASLDV